jgi:ABC-type microcin C transport system permease subunit YejB
MGTSITLIKQWERESIECAPGGIVDQRVARINAKNDSLPVTERNRREAKLAKQKAAALKPEDSSGQVLRVDLLHIKKHRSKKEYSVIDGFTHEAMASGLKTVLHAKGVLTMVSAAPEYSEKVDPLEAA